MKKKFLFFWIALFLSLALCAQARESSEDKILKDKIGQMLMVGFNGYELTSKNPIYKDVKNGTVGGVILFNKNADTKRPKNVKNIKNPPQLKKLISDLQYIAPTKLFIAVDQEGGPVSRFDASYFYLPSRPAAKLGYEFDPGDTYDDALRTARFLKAFGINVNFAPCVDLNINPNNQAIAKLGRSYSFNPYVVSAHARKVIVAHKEENILTVPKHFPGQGSADADTHFGIADVTKTYNNAEVVPYGVLMNLGLVDAVMVAHVYNSTWDKNYPASMSKQVITGILRKNLNFDGLVFTDDIQMAALAKNYPLDTILFQAINAGADVIIIGNNLNYDPKIARKAQKIIFNQVRNGKISKNRIDESYQRIIAQKRKLGLIN